MAVHQTLAPPQASPSRVSGTVRRTPVKVLGVAGQDHVVALDSHAAWPRNLRAAPGPVEL